MFKNVTEVFILVPALLGLKGNLEMTLASRLSTAVSNFLFSFPLQIGVVNFWKQVFGTVVIYVYGLIWLLRELFKSVIKLAKLERHPSSNLHISKFYFFCLFWVIIQKDKVDYWDLHLYCQVGRCLWPWWGLNMLTWIFWIYYSKDLLTPK